MPDVRSPIERDTTTDIVRLVVVHAAVIAVIVLVIGVFLVPVWAAVPSAILIGAGATALRLRNVDERAAATMGAGVLHPGERPRLESVAESVAMAVGVAPPTLYVIDDSACNAIVWGSDAGTARCAFTTGLLDSMDRVQLEAVVGHQLAVVNEGCVDLVTIAGALLGPLARGPLEEPVASIVHRTLRDRSVVAADLESVRATRFPPGLVSALEAVRGVTTTLSAVPPALSVLCFAAPGGDEGPFSVHPPLEDRIDLLREI